MGVTVKGQDAAYNGVVLGPGDVAWTVSGPGAISPAGRYSATAPGTATVVATAGGVQGTATVTVRLDTFPPVARAPTFTLVASTTMPASTVPVAVTWPAATDVGRGVKGYQLQRAVGSAWVSVPLANATDTSATVMLTPGLVHRLRVRAIDRAGNIGAWATAAAFRLSAVQETSSAILRKGAWSTKLSAAFVGGRAIAASVAGASVAITFTGQQIGWVSTVGPTRGQARIYVDGAYERTVDLGRATSASRLIMVLRSWPVAGRHTLEIRVVGTAGRPRVDVDAFVIVAPTP
jgi:hypothetical protein